LALVESNIVQILFTAFTLLIILAPAVIVLLSDRVQGGEKLLFAVAVLFTSWLGLLLFLLLTRRDGRSDRPA
jgi:MFS family permease